MKQFVRLFALLSLFVTGSVLAHSGLVSSTPADRAMVHQSPAQLELQFSGPVVLANLSVASVVGEAVDLGDYRTTEAKPVFVIDLPELAPESYIVNWTAMGGDGHKMSGSFSFTYMAHH